MVKFFSCRILLLFNTILPDDVVPRYILILKVYLYVWAQTFAIRLAVHHKPNYIWEVCALRCGSSNNSCLLFLVVVIVRLLSNMSLHSFRIALTKIKNLTSAYCFNKKEIK